MSKHQPSSCPHRPKPESSKPLFTFYQSFPTPQMSAAISWAVSSQRIHLHWCISTAAAQCCRCWTDTQTELPGWTGRVSEVMQSLLISPNLEPAVHTRPAPHSSPELSTPTASGHINHDPERHLCHLQHHPGGAQLYELR